MFSNKFDDLKSNPALTDPKYNESKSNSIFCNYFLEQIHRVFREYNPKPNEKKMLEEIKQMAKILSTINIDEPHMLKQIFRFV